MSIQQTKIHEMSCSNEFKSDATLTILRLDDRKKFRFVIHGQLGDYLELDFSDKEVQALTEALIERNNKQIFPNEWDQ